MTVKEMIARLETYPPGALMLIRSSESNDHYREAQVNFYDKHGDVVVVIPKYGAPQISASILDDGWRPTCRPAYPHKVEKL